MPAASSGDKSANTRAVFLQFRFLAVVFAGGMLGTTARYLIGAALPAEVGKLPWATFAVNTTGAFLLAFLLFGLSRRGSDRGVQRPTRLGLGTGFMGSFTTYSAFAVETNDLLATAGPATALAYAAGTVLAGLAAAIVGLVLARVLVAERTEGR